MFGGVPPGMTEAAEVRFGLRRMRVTRATQTGPRDLTRVSVGSLPEFGRPHGDWVRCHCHENWDCGELSSGSADAWQPHRQ